MEVGSDGSAPDRTPPLRGLGVVRCDGDQVGHGGDDDHGGDDGGNRGDRGRGRDLPADQETPEAARLGCAAGSVATHVVDDRSSRRLRRALGDGELHVHFQPVVALATSTVVGFEALLRWQRPGRGLLAPADFLADVQAAGLMAPVGRCVLEAAVAVIAELRGSRRARPDSDTTASDTTASDTASLTIAVNIGSDQLAVPGLADAVLSLLAARVLPGRALVLEIPETTVITDFDVAATELGRLRAAGVGICLDDYGTGRSGLHRLLELPFSSLKLDHTLTGQLGSDPRIGAVVTSTAALADDLGLALVVEGVETPEQHRILLASGYTHGQGWLFGHAVPPEQLPALLAGRPPAHGRWHPSQGLR